MVTLDEILEHYSKPTLTEEQVTEIKDRAQYHLYQYLLGEGEVHHLCEYNDLMDMVE